MATTTNSTSYSTGTSVTTTRKTSPTKTGRLIQPNNLLKVLTTNVQSLLPKIDELIALIQVENFDVIALNETGLDTQNKHLYLQKFPYMVTKVFMWTNQLHRSGRGSGSIIYVKNTLNPIERKSSATCTREIIQVYLPNIDWTLQRPTPAPGNKLMQLLADNNLTQHVHETTGQNNILDLVISTEE